MSSPRGRGTSPGLHRGPDPGRPRATSPSRSTSAAPRDSSVPLSARRWRVRDQQRRAEACTIRTRRRGARHIVPVPRGRVAAAPTWPAASCFLPVSITIARTTFTSTSAGFPMATCGSTDADRPIGSGSVPMPWRRTTADERSEHRAVDLDRPLGDRVPAEGLDRALPAGPAHLGGPGRVGDDLDQRLGEVGDVLVRVERRAGAVGGLLDRHQPAGLAVRRRPRGCRRSRWRRRRSRRPSPRG